MSFINDIIKSSGNKYATIASDGIGGSDVTGFIDTGSYTFNALVSGSLYGGIPNNKIIALAGESATGKTFFAIGMVKQFLDNNKDAVVLYFDTEQAVTSDMFSSRGIDSKRVAIFPVATVEDFRNQMITIADKYLEQDEAKGAKAPPATAWSFADAFQGPQPTPQTPWEMLAQVLLMSNEFVFVD